MNLDKLVIFFAGMMVLLSAALTQWHHQNWIWLTIFIGLNMIQSSLTGFCPIVFVMKRAGIRAGTAFK
ncbi:sulfurtransferase [candidate division KSB3 bacterium]|uniref:Sulfurtransferase n=1 Tax=candidate division KSB3 bacterium TaxID=2044937 RepID=A0A2G6K917_9BACT|nr:MAG: sulfurtransferase [candidate division KSB3 bacterium]